MPFRKWFPIFSPTHRLFANLAMSWWNVARDWEVKLWNHFTKWWAFVVINYEQILFSVCGKVWWNEMRCASFAGICSYKYLVLYFKGSRVWLLEGKDWVPATVTESNGGQVTFRTEYDKVSFHVNESLKTVSTTRHVLIATIVRTSPPILAWYKFTDMTVWIINDLSR